jgi:hypothetical protein
VRRSFLLGTVSLGCLGCLVMGALGVASCANVIGLDQVQRVDCAADCGADGAAAVDAPRGADVLGVDSKGMDAPRADALVDARADAPGAEAEAGGCTRDSDCRSPDPRCDLTTGRCVPCLPQNDNCPAGMFCSPLNGSYACAMGCATAGDCTALDAGGGDGGSKACCNHLCVDTSANNANCGVCNNACMGGSPACCSSSCVDESSSAANCGGCGQACSNSNMASVTCGGGLCNGTCSAGFADCNMNKLTDGCETNIATNPADCGGCGLACSSNNMASIACGAGNCDGTCNAGFADCNNNKLIDGCEVDLANDPGHCGGCGNVCSINNMATVLCGNGVCDGACNAGFADCNNNKLFDGCEVNVGSDPSHCGGCATVCSTNNIATPTCGGGVCNGACNAGFADCNGNKLTDGCETNISANTADCGGCGLVCSTNNMATVTCGGGTCNGTCSAGFADCNSNKLTDGCETNTNTSATSCGMCGHACSAGFTCAGGTCAAVYTVGASPQAFVDACTIAGHTNLLATVDDGASALIAMPISFVFYGTTVTQYWVNADGAMGFGTPFGTFIYPCLPSASDPELAIMPFAVDLVQRANGICVGVIGAAPNRQMVLTESDGYVYNDATTHVTYSVFLNESTDTIDVVYLTMTGANAQGQTAVVGVQDGTGTDATQFSCDTTSEPAGTAIRFTP